MSLLVLSFQKSERELHDFRFSPNRSIALAIVSCSEYFSDPGGAVFGRKDDLDILGRDEEDGRGCIMGFTVISCTATSITSSPKILTNSVLFQY